MHGRILYGVPSGGHPKISWVHSVMEIMAGCRTNAFFEDWQKHDFADSQLLVHQARNAIVTHALEAGYEYAVMHDDDTVICMNPKAGNIIDAMVATMESDPKIALIGCPVRMQSTIGIFGPNVKLFHPDYSDFSPIPDVVEMLKGFPKQPFEIDTIGAAFIMIRAEAFKNIADPFRFSRFHNRWDQDVECSEDLGACFLLKERGWKVYCEPRFRSQHLKDGAILTWDPETWEEKFEIPDDVPIITCGPDGNYICRNGIVKELLDAKAARQREQFDSFADFRRHVSERARLLQQGNGDERDQAGGSGSGEVRGEVADHCPGGDPVAP